MNDVADNNPKLLQELLVLWDNYVLENGVIPLQPELGEYIEALDEQMTVSFTYFTCIIAVLTFCRRKDGWNTNSGNPGLSRTQRNSSQTRHDSRGWTGRQLSRLHSQLS